MEKAPQAPEGTTIVKVDMVYTDGVFEWKTREWGVEVTHRAYYKEFDQSVGAGIDLRILKTPLHEDEDESKKYLVFDPPGTTVRFLVKLLSYKRSDEVPCPDGPAWTQKSKRFKRRKLGG